MSQRRKVGDHVWLTPGAGMVGESARLAVTILAEDDPPPCLDSCQVLYGEPGGDPPPMRTEEEFEAICIEKGCSGCSWLETLPNGELCFRCHDPACREWSNVITDPDTLAGGERYYLCHVSECKMFDETQK